MSVSSMKHTTLYLFLVTRLMPFLYTFLWYHASHSSLETTQARASDPWLSQAINSLVDRMCSLIDRILHSSSHTALSEINMNVSISFFEKTGAKFWFSHRGEERIVWERWSLPCLVQHRLSKAQPNREEKAALSRSLMQIVRESLQHRDHLQFPNTPNCFSKAHNDPSNINLGSTPSSSSVASSGHVHGTTRKANNYERNNTVYGSVLTEPSEPSLNFPFECGITVQNTRLTATVTPGKAVVEWLAGGDTTSSSEFDTWGFSGILKKALSHPH